MAEFSKIYSVAEGMIEPVYNHVHHATALRLLERARLDFLEERGFPTEHFLEQQQFLVITRIEIDYKRELFAGEVRIDCGRVELTDKEISIHQTIFNHRDKLAVQAVVTSALLNGATKRSMRLPAEFVEAIGSREK